MFFLEVRVENLICGLLGILLGGGTLASQREKSLPRRILDCVLGAALLIAGALCLSSAVRMGTEEDDGEEEA